MCEKGMYTKSKGERAASEDQTKEANVTSEWEQIDGKKSQTKAVT